MLNHSPEILKEITDYLTSRHIPFRAYERGGIVTFSAATLQTENLYDYTSTAAAELTGFYPFPPVFSIAAAEPSGGLSKALPL